MRWIVIGGLFILSATPTNANPPISAAQPDSAFLEFIGSWESDEGQWINPLELLEESADIDEENVEPPFKQIERSTGAPLDYDASGTRIQKSGDSQHE